MHFGQNLLLNANYMDGKQKERKKEGKKERKKERKYIAKIKQALSCLKSGDLIVKIEWKFLATKF